MDRMGRRGPAGRRRRRLGCLGLEPAGRRVAILLRPRVLPPAVVGPASTDGTCLLRLRAGGERRGIPPDGGVSGRVPLGVISSCGARRLQARRPASAGPVSGRWEQGCTAREQVHSCGAGGDERGEARHRVRTDGLSAELDHQRAGS